MTVQILTAPVANGISTIFTGAASFIQVTDSANTLNFGANDFTLECWVNVTNFQNSNATIYAPAAGTINALSFRVSATNLTIDRYGVAVEARTPTITISTNTWIHLAFVRQGANLRIYKDGVQQVANAITQTQYNNSNVSMIGGLGVNDATLGYLKGSISNFRYVLGNAIYPDGTTFTPSTTPLTNVANTKILTCRTDPPINTPNGASSVNVASIGTLGWGNSPFAYATNPVEGVMDSASPTPYSSVVKAKLVSIVDGIAGGGLMPYSAVVKTKLLSTVANRGIAPVDVSGVNSLRIGKSKANGDMPLNKVTDGNWEYYFNAQYLLGPKIKARDYFAVTVDTKKLDYQFWS